MRLSDFRIARLLCRLIGHRWDEFKLRDVLCSRCRTCRAYTQEDLANLAAKAGRRAG